MARPTDTELKVETDKFQTSVETIYAMFDTNSGNDRDDHTELESLSRVLRGLERDLHNFHKSVIREQEVIVEPRTKVRNDRTAIGDKIGDSARAALPDPVL